MANSLPFKGCKHFGGSRIFGQILARERSYGMGGTLCRALKVFLRARPGGAIILGHTCG